MDDFPEGSMKEEDSMMDVLDAAELDTTSEDYRDFRANLSTPVSAQDQCKISWCLFALKCPSPARTQTGTHTGALLVKLSWNGNKTIDL